MQLIGLPCYQGNHFSLCFMTLKGFITHQCSSGQEHENFSFFPVVSDSTYPDILIFYKFSSMNDIKRLTPSPTYTFFSLLLTLWRNFPINMKGKRFICSECRTICLLNVSINCSTKDSECFPFFWVHSFISVQKGMLSQKCSYQALNISLQSCQLLLLELLKEKKYTFKDFTIKFHSGQTVEYWQY